MAAIWYKENVPFRGTLTKTGKLVDVEVWNWWCIQFEKQEEILIDKYYTCVKVIHKVVLDIYWIVVLVKVC